MSKQYIELSSGYRDRLQYPNPAKFTVSPCELNAENKLENSNDVSRAYPFYNFWSLPLNIIKRWDEKTSATTIVDTGYYKPELVPMNYGLDSFLFSPASF